MNYTVNVNVIRIEEVEVSFELNELFECMGTDEKIEFIKEQTEKQYEGIKEVCFDEGDLSDLEEEIDDMNDLSDMLPNESYEEYMEHENLE